MIALFLRRSFAVLVVAGFFFHPPVARGQSRPITNFAGPPEESAGRFNTPQGAATAGQTDSQKRPANPSTMQTVDPTPAYFITWTATGKSIGEVSGSGQTEVVSRKVTMAGSGVFRVYAAGGYDLFPYDLTVTDDSDYLLTGISCGGSSRKHNVCSITDPNFYTTGRPDSSPVILPPSQRPDGSWYMEDPFASWYMGANFYYDHFYFPYQCLGELEACGMLRQESVSYFQHWYADLRTPGQLEGDAQGKVFTKSTLFQVPSIIIDLTNTPLTLTVQWDVTVRKLEGRDLAVDRLEITQGLQDETNSIPLVQGRRTVVRAYIGVGREPLPVPGVTGKLSGYVNGVLLGTVPPFNPGGQITAPYNPNWLQINDTLNFELPYAWTEQPTLRLEVEVNPDDHAVTELNYGDNKRSTLMTFLPCSGVVVQYMLLRYTPPAGFAPADPSANTAAGQEFMRKIYPIPDKGLAYFPRETMTLSDDINAAGNDDALLAFLSRLLLSSSAPRAEHIYAWLPQSAYNDNGLGYKPGVAAFGNDTENQERWRRTFAHEIGHNYGFDHVDSTTAGAHWFDVYDRVIKPVPASVGGADLLDVMVPARLEPEAWISRQNYESLVAKKCSGAGAAAAATSGLEAAGDVLLVTGIIRNTTPAAGSLDPLLRLSTVPAVILPSGSQYCVILKDAANAVLSQYCFNQSFSIDSTTPRSSMPFAMVVPYPAGLHSVELTGSSILLDTRIASSNPPTVTVTFPDSAGLTLNGAQNVSWTAADPDGDALTYTILYSRDNGATWMGVGSMVTGNSYNLDFSGLPGTTGASGRIKVMVSDGFNSAEDVSDNPFAVGNKPPTAAIISPHSGTSFMIGPKVVLQGAGADLDDGALDDSALSWTSSLDGALGAGQLLETNLSAGTHTITLTVTDRGGLTNSASIQVTVTNVPTLGATANPNPQDGATNLSSPGTLSWSAAVNATSYDVYFGTSPAPPLLTNTTTTSASIQTTPGTQYFWQLVSKNSSGSTWGPAWTFTTVTATFPVGDANGDGTVSVADVFYLINNLFAGGPSPVGSGDANGDGSVSVADVFYLINYLFAGGPAPKSVAPHASSLSRGTSSPDGAQPIATMRLGTATGVAGGTVTLPVVLRGATQIDGLSFRIHYKAPAVRSITIRRAGVLAGLSPLLEARPQTADSASYIVALGAPLPLEAEALVAEIEIVLSNDIGNGQPLALVFDRDTTTLSNGGSTAMANGPGLRVEDGSIAFPAGNGRRGDAQRGQKP